MDMDMDEIDTDELSQFRQEWKRELGLSTDDDRASEGLCDVGQRDEQAAELYMMGVAAESSGDVHNAVLYYRQAEQMVPDIEMRVHHQSPKDVSTQTIQSGLTTCLTALSICDLVCQPNRTQTDTHISQLPCEVVSYILRWVVSSDLDVRSLEQCSMVCRGFHILARDQGLWKSVCLRVWGKICASSYTASWRELFLHTPHIHFNGVYISKSSYVRQGEKSLDGFYKPFHTVSYYRYLRFFTDGSVMYQTSPAEPQSQVSKLQHKHSSDSVHLGTYTLGGDKAYLTMPAVQPTSGGRARHKRNQPVSSNEYNFHLELCVTGTHFSKLTWLDHYCQSVHRGTGQSQITHFTIDYKYTPFVFSRVRSFTNESHAVL